MATIKDVAKYAGVSHGTVSNVLKGVSSVSLENVRKVEKAIQELGYAPDASARSLKMENSSKIGIVLPNITDPFYAQLYTQLSLTFRSKGYEPLLYITDNVVETERALLSSLESIKPAGVVIASCQPNATQYFSNAISHSTAFVFIQREITDLSCNYIGFRNDETVFRAVKELFSQGAAHIGLVAGSEKYSSELLCVQGYRRAIGEAGLSVDENYIRFTNGHDSDAFVAAIHLLSLPNPPDAIICTDTQLVNGVLGAMKYNTSRSPRIYALSEDTWNDSRFSATTLLPRPSLRMSDTVAELLLENIRSAPHFTQRRILLDSAQVYAKPSRQMPIAARPACTLHLSMIEGDMSDAVRALLPDLQRSTGIRAEMDVYSHEHLYDAIYRNSLCSEVDVFSVDILWLQEMAARGLLADLSPVVGNKLLNDLDIEPNLVEDFSRHNGRVFGFPFHYCNQLLFYRKDLFENTALRRMYYEQNKRELKCPTTWSEFNRIARFFTRAYNPESPTTYGTTLGCRFSSAATCEFLPRFSAFGAKICDSQSKVTLASPSAVNALANYCESFRYASPDSTEHWWHEQVEEFAAGDTAMMIVFSSYVSRLADPSTSAVVGKIGVANIPGNCPTLGGWSLCINRNSKQFDAALEFLKWCCSKELAFPSMLLGGMPASSCVYSSNEIRATHPWVKKSLEVFPTSHRRGLPKGGEHIGIKRFEEIIAKAVHDCATGIDQPEHALQEAARILEESMRQ